MLLTCLLLNIFFTSRKLQTSTWMGDRFRMGKARRCKASHSDQLSLRHPFVGSRFEYQLTLRS